MALIETLIDNFDDNSLDTGLWDNWGGAKVKEQNGRIETTGGTANGDYFGMDSVNTYNFTNSAVFIEMIDPGLSHANRVTTPIEIHRNANNAYYWEFNNGSMQAWKVHTGTYDTIGSALTYNNTTHRWFRLRNAGSTVYYDYSADGVNWVNHTSVSTSGTGAITAMGITTCMLGNEGAVPTNSVAYFDNLNFVPASDVTNGFKVFDGTEFIVKPVKWYNGSAWVEKPLKRWNGSEWVAVEY